MQSEDGGRRRERKCRICISASKDREDLYNSSQSVIGVDLGGDARLCNTISLFQSSRPCAERDRIYPKRTSSHARGSFWRYSIRSPSIFQITVLVSATARAVIGLLLKSKRL